MGTKPVATPEAWRSRIVGHGEADPATLIANPRNWRTHPPEQRAALVAELDRVGFVQSVVVNRTTGLLVDGHLRVEVAVERRVPTIPVVYVELTEEEEQRVLVALDPLGSMAGADATILASLMDGLALENEALERHLVSFLAGPKAPTGDPEYVPPVQPETYVQPGDLWILGDHRMIVGDATDAAVVERLLDGARPRLLVTDPPYGVQLDPTWRDGLYNAMCPGEKPYMQKPGHHFPVGQTGPDGKRSQGRDVPGTKGYMRTEGHQNTTLSGDTIVDWSPAFALVPSLEVAYVWHAGIHASAVAIGMQGLGFEIRSQIIWAKTQFAMSRGAYHWQHEPCWFAVRKGATAKWIGPHDLSTLWELASPKMIMGGSHEEKLDHPAQKPIECMQRPIEHHEGDVYEPFLGSGTTLIGAERVGRRCFGVEIEPRYAQLVITRWQEFTGREATRG